MLTKKYCNSTRARRLPYLYVNPRVTRFCSALTSGNLNEIYLLSYEFAHLASQKMHLKAINTMKRDSKVAGPSVSLDRHVSMTVSTAKYKELVRAHISF